MKQKITILIVIFVGVILFVGCIYDEPSIKTGDYPFIKEGKMWSCYAHYYNYNFNYKMMGDTTIGTKTYKKIYIQNSTKYGDEAWYYYGAVREKRDEVYMIDAEEKKEFLLYDWGIDLYDSEIGLDYFTTKGEINLFFRDITPYKNTNRRLYRYSMLQIISSYYWLEGVGDLGNPFKPCDLGSSLISCFEDDVCIYQSDNE